MLHDVIFLLELAKMLICFIGFRKKMASARGSNEDALAYEQIRLATIASNKRKLDSLNLASMLNVAPKGPSKIRKKACPNMFISAFFIITIDSIMFLCCRGLITQVL